MRCRASLTGSNACWCRPGTANTWDGARTTVAARFRCSPPIVECDYYVVIPQPHIARVPTVSHR